VYNDEAVDGIKRYSSWLKKPYAIYPGGYEMEALATGAFRAFKGIEPLRVYGGTD